MIPSTSEQFFFDNNGYLVLEGFLDPEHVCRLTEALNRVILRRRTQEAGGVKYTGVTQMAADSTRVFYILHEDPLFLELMDWPALMPYVHTLLNKMPHHHASDAIVERGMQRSKMGWHIDGHDSGYRNLASSGGHIPLLQLKVGYFLSDMTQLGQGNLCVVPGSHKSTLEPDPADLQNPALFPGAMQICAPAGSAVLFHNALWHSSGPWTRDEGERVMLYYAYEHPWMVGSQEHWSYPPEFYAALTPSQRALFHGFVFDPPERRWG